MQSSEHASAFLQALGGDTVQAFRCIHDTNKALPAHNYRGTLQEHWQTLVNYNNQGYGIFLIISEMDGVGYELPNVKAVRAHFVDLDNLSAMQNLERARQWSPAPSFAVQTSPGKAHVYWPVVPYRDNEAFNLRQRKLNQFFDGDKSVIDPTRVMRLPGFYHLKAQPHLITCFALPGYGTVTHPSMFDVALAGVNVIDAYGGARHELGDPALAAPSLEWLSFALNKIDPNELDRGEWISVTSAFKQAGWSLASEQALFYIWSSWCARYNTVDAQGRPLVNDPGENLKNWNSIRNTEIGWKSFERRVPVLLAYLKLGMPAPVGASAAPLPINGHALEMPAQGAQPGVQAAAGDVPDASAVVAAQPVAYGEILDANEQRQWFDKCVFIVKFGEILMPDGSLLNATQFNGAKGGKKFIIDSVGKITDEAWKAATRSTLWTLPKAHHTRFLPHVPTGEMIPDELGRIGVNAYKKSNIIARPGDVTMFLRHMELILPEEQDRRIIFDYLAHNVKYPGHKIPWAPLIQSTEGVGKGAIKRVMRHSMGGISRVHFPNARELLESGSKFNGWMRAKLMIVCDEIKVDERRDMIEVLKPMISEELIEIQSKGHDQETEDNYANWFFFSNYKDAIPVNKNGRRFSIFYSAVQSVEDLTVRGMDQAYFDRLYDWLDNGNGCENMAHWLLNYNIERGAIPMRAPETTSKLEALRQSRGPIEITIMNAIDDALPGFKNGYVSVTAALKLIKASGARMPSVKTVESILETLGYVNIGRSPRPYFQEEVSAKSQIFAKDGIGTVETYGNAQGYE